MTIFLLAAQMIAGGTGPVDCLRPLTREELRQDEVGRASRKRAGDLMVLEPGDDQLPPSAPANFRPQLVTISYLTGPDGRVSDCVADGKSEIIVFNSASCDLLSKRLRSVAPSPSRTRQKLAVNWTPRAVLPQRRQCANNRGTVPISSHRWIDAAVFEGTRVQAGSAMFALDVGAAGRVEKCAIVAADVDAVLQRNLCAMALRRAIVLPAIDAAGNPAPATLTFVVRFRIAG